MDHNEEKRVQRKQELYKSSDGLAKFGVFATTTAINSSTTMLKDKFYAKHFGAAKASLKVPMITYGLWGLRDCMVIGSSFILPDVMSGILEEQHDFDKKTAQKLSQFACPVVAQFVSGEHLILPFCSIFNVQFICLRCNIFNSKHHRLPGQCSC
jgi:hypothetical protein